MSSYTRLNLYKVKYDTENRRKVRKLRYYFSKFKIEAERRKIQKAIMREFGTDMPVLEEKVRQQMFNTCMEYINSCKIA
jgi:sulfur relay (sulfurtransferase) DsrC/TusE family protein